MKLPLSAYAIELTSYALHIALLVVSPLIAPKYFVVFSIPASCSVLLAPFPLFITCFFTQKYGTVYGYEIVWKSVVACMIMAALIGLVNRIPMAPNSVVSAEVWDEVLGIAAKMTIGWALIYGLGQWCVVWAYNQRLFSSLSLSVIVSVLWGSLVGSVPVVALVVYMGIMSLPVEAFVGSIGWFSIFTLGIGFVFFLVKSAIEKGWLKGIVYSSPSTAPLYGLYPWLLTLFWLMLLLTNIAVVKWFAIKNYFFTVGLLSYPFTFVCTDLIAELYGKKQAKYAVWTGFVASTAMMAIVLLAIWLPIYKDSPLSQKAFSAIFGFTPAIVLASMLAYISSQLTDIYLFESLRMRTHGKHLWLRNNVSTMVSQLVDTLVFSFCVWVIWPKLDFTSSTVQVATGYWYELTRNEYVGKLMLALLDTPLVYAGVKLMKRYA